MFLKSIFRLPTLDNLKSNAAIGVGSVFLSSGFGILWKQWTNLQTRKLMVKGRPQRLIVITGCDSGLGFSMAYWSGKLGYKVVAGCLNYESDGSQMLRKEFVSDAVFVVQLDVTNLESIENFQIECKRFLEKNSKQNLRLWAVVPNAAVASFGEFFWYTLEQQHKMMDVNFWGTVNFTKAFESLLLTYKCRLIIVTSDCAEFPLQTLSTYCASKAALQTWAVALRQEVAKYGISVVSFQPGSFPTKSNLFSGQNKVYEEMKRTMSETNLEFYGDYFHEFNQRNISIFSDKKTSFDLLEDSLVYKTFQSLLETDVRFKPIVKAEQTSEQIFHFLMRNLPVRIADALLVKSLQYPQWKPKLEYSAYVENHNTQSLKSIKEEPVNFQKY